MNYSKAFIEVSHNIKVEVRPEYLETESLPADRRHVFGYYIKIFNQGEQTVQLLKRHWKIHDSNGDDFEVDGEGVIGRKPFIEPGAMHEYNSFCVLKSFRGTMSGYYLMDRDNGETIKVAIPQFFLRSHRLN